MRSTETDEPRYLRIQRILEEQILQGKLPAGSQLPGERDLARQFGVSQMTVNRAIQELVRKGRLYRRSGAGTFVTDAVQPVRVHGVVLVVPYAEHPQADTYLREPFRAAKAEIDAMLAKQYGIAVADLRPWHYHDPFFQEAPAAYDINLDAFYKDANIARLAQTFYAGIGMDVSDILARSDLYEKPGKCPHAFCTDMDREGDVRVLCNIVPDEDWMGTTLHELGHAVYDKYIDRSLPYVARSAAHSFTTEGVAMLMERFAKRGDWMKSMGLNVQDPQAINRLAERIQRDKLLIFAAWSQVMVRFEMSMYENPDQDLNKLWWDLIEKYQLIARPAGRNAPDYAAKIHVVSSPCYYHSYMMGEMFAAQLHRAICRDVLKTDPRTAQYTGRKDVGQYMVEKVFAPGSRMKWDEFVPFATGEALSPKALIESLR